MTRICDNCGSEIDASGFGPTPEDHTLIYVCQDCGHTVRGIIDFPGPPPEKQIKMYVRFNLSIRKEDLFHLYHTFPHLQKMTIVDVYKTAASEQILYLGKAGESVFEAYRDKNYGDGVSFFGVSETRQ